MQKHCSNDWCGQAFEVTDDDHALRAKLTPVFNGSPYPFPEPTLCFDCRLQRRLAFYNVRSLYKRTCDSSGKTIVSIFSPDKPFKVYEKDIWYGDSWDPMEYGRDFDFTRPFFEQFRALMEAVPQQSLTILGQHVNSDFTNDNISVKNCYLIFDGERAEDCMFGHTFVGTKSCIDFIALVDSELCYEVIHCANCYNCKYSRYSQNCWDSWFLRDCIGCKHCFGCANLRQKEYCIFNEQKTKEEYEKFMQSFASTSWTAIQNIKKEAEAFLQKLPVKAVRGEQNINALGDNLNQSKDSYCCFDSTRIQDCRYCTNCLVGAKDCMDVHIWGNGMELCYESGLIGVNVRNVACGYYISESCDNVYYSTYCSRQCSNLLGCVGLKHKKHCIFNKQYSPDQYENLAGKIVEHMQKTGEWGEYFPHTVSAFGYNETMAQTFFPLPKNDVQEKGWKWSDYESIVEADRVIQAVQLPDDQTVVPDDVLAWAIVCEKTAKPFKITKQELQFYRDQQLPLPRRHPDQRHADRFAFKNPYKLWERQCAKCNAAIQTAYAPERPEIVYCESCYLAEVY